MLTAFGNLSTPGLVILLDLLSQLSHEHLLEEQKSRLFSFEATFSSCGCFHALSVKKYQHFQ